MFSAVDYFCYSNSKRAQDFFIKLEYFGFSVTKGLPSKRVTLLSVDTKVHQPFYISIYTYNVCLLLSRGVNWWETNIFGGVGEGRGVNSLGEGGVGGWGWREFSVAPNSARWKECIYIYRFQTL